MNLLTFARTCVFSAACLIFPLQSALAAPAGSNVLKVQVTAPRTWQPISGDSVQNAFVDRVAQLFGQSGLNIPVAALSPVEDSSKAAYLLSINLSDRTINARGGLDFTFTASLTTPEGRRDLGRFTGSVADWLPNTGKFDLGRPLADAADSALRLVCEEVLTAELSRTPITQILL